MSQNVIILLTNGIPNKLNSRLPARKDNVACMKLRKHDRPYSWAYQVFVHVTNKLNFDEFAVINER